MADVLLTGLAAYWITWVIRTWMRDLGNRVGWAWPITLVECKPVCCNVCMAFWAALPMYSNWRQHLASAGVALILLTLGKAASKAH